MKNILIKDMQRYDFFIFSTSFPLFFLAILFNLFDFFTKCRKIEYLCEFYLFFKNTFQFDDDDKV